MNQSNVAIDTKEPDSDLISSEIRDKVKSRIWKALEGLTYHQRFAIITVHLGGMTVEEASYYLNTNPAALRIHLNHGQGKLRESLKGILDEI